MSNFESKKEKYGVNSHIQLPKCSLIPFVDTKKYIYYYDFETNEVKRSTPKKFNVEHGYYYLEIEEYLNKIETAFSRIISFIKETDFDNETINMPNNFRDTVLDYLYALMGRSNIILKTLLENSFSSNLFPLQHNRNFAAYIGIETARKEGFYSDYLITFMKNKSSVPFVLPCYGAYDFGLEDGQYINMPITPKISIVFVPKEASEKYIENNKIKMIEIEKDELIDQLNTQAFLREMQTNKRGVVATSREQLQKIAEKFNKNIKCS